MVGAPGDGAVDALDGLGEEFCVLVALEERVGPCGDDEIVGGGVGGMWEVGADVSEGVADASFEGGAVVCGPDAAAYGEAQARLGVEGGAGVDDEGACGFLEFGFEDGAEIAGVGDAVSASEGEAHAVTVAASGGVGRVGGRCRGRRWRRWR